MRDLNASLWEQRHAQNAEGCCKTTVDLERYLHIFEAYRPDGIVECGSWEGHSALWFARSAGCAVISVDTSDLALRHHDPAAVAEAGVTFVQGDSTGPQVHEAVLIWARHRQRILVSLDSDHSPATVYAELRNYAPLVAVGGWCVVEDGIVRWLAEMAQFYGDGPLEAVERWLGEQPGWVADAEVEDRWPTTQHPGGWLRRVA